MVLPPLKEEADSWSQVNCPPLSLSEVTENLCRTLLSSRNTSTGVGSCASLLAVRGGSAEEDAALEVHVPGTFFWGGVGWRKGISIADATNKSIC